jgi:phosphoribosylanthranilate isomerase
MTWVKICGMTNLEDALVAVEAGADAVGFVFSFLSPRNIHPEDARKIAALLPVAIEKVGVFVSRDPRGVESMRRMVYQAGLTAIQVYGQAGSLTGSRALDEFAAIGKKIFVAWPTSMVFRGRLGGAKWRSEAKNKVAAILLDSGKGQKPGGTGKAFDWAKASTILNPIRKDFNFVVAGGLNPKNVVDAIDALKPWGVDVSSGVEARPGKKDPEKVRAFVQAVREYDRSVS